MAAHPSPRWWVRWAVLVGWLGCGLVPALASAEPVADPCLADAQCQDLINRARTLSKAQKYEPALAAYRAAQALHPVVWLLVNIGRMEHKLGRHADAIAHYREYLARTDSDGDSELRQKARQYLQETEVEQGLAPSSPPSPHVTPPSPEPQPPAAPREPITKKWSYKKFFRSDGREVLERRMLLMPKRRGVSRGTTNTPYGVGLRPANVAGTFYGLPTYLNNAQSGYPASSVSSGSATWNSMPLVSR